MGRPMPHMGPARGVAQHRKFKQPMVDGVKVLPALPYFGKKLRCASLVWSRLGRVHTYVEPCCGSLSVALQSPYGAAPVEVFNDVDGYVCNFLRAVRNHPARTASAADRLNVHQDYSAARALVKSSEPGLVERLFDDLDYCDPDLAGLWAWCMCLSVDLGRGMSTGYSSERRYDAFELPSVGYVAPSGVVDGLTERVVPDGSRLLPWFEAISVRIREAFVLSRDWSVLFEGAMRRVRGPGRLVGVFFDPPYPGLEAPYAHSRSIGLDIYDWCVENGDDPLVRICLAGYEGMYPEFPEGWTSAVWKRANGLEMLADGWASSDEAGRVETLWFSPNCLTVEQSRLV